MKQDNRRYTLFITPNKRANYGFGSKPVDNRNLKPLLKMMNKAAKSKAEMYFHILEVVAGKPETVLFLRNF